MIWIKLFVDRYLRQKVLNWIMAKYAYFIGLSKALCTIDFLNDVEGRVAIKPTVCIL